MHFLDFHNNSDLMEKEGGEIEVVLSKFSPQVGLQDQFIGGVWWPRVTPHDAVARFGGAEPHTSIPQDQGVAEPQMGGILADDISQLSGTSRCLRCERSPVQIYR